MTPSRPWPYSFPMKPPPFLDVIAGLITLILVVAVVVYPIFGVECPQIVASGFAAGLGWILRGAVAVQNGIISRQRSAPNGAPSPTGTASPGSQ